MASSRQRNRFGLSNALPFFVDRLHILRFSVLQRFRNLRGIMKFKKLQIENWRQFSSIDLELHPRLTVLTGANGAGKSTLIRVFSQHLGFQRPLFGTPFLADGGALSYFSGIFSRRGRRLFQRISKTRQTDQRQVGTIVYDNGVEANLTVPDISGAQFQIAISNQQRVFGTHIDSHQPTSGYKGVSQIPLNPITAQVAYSHYSQEINNAYNGSRSNFSPMYRLKEALISFAVFGEGNSEVKGNPELLDMYREFQEVLDRVLPDTLGFRGIRVQPPEVILETRSGDFIIDSASGGVTALIDFAWRLFTFSRLHSNFVVTIDEPENHLHPTLQRELMPRLLSAFPDVQFIIATHSPFMVSSVKDAGVYALRYKDFDLEDELGHSFESSAASRVESIRLDSIKRAATANEILREVLGVPATMPSWAHQEVRAILDDFQDRDLNEESIAALRKNLEDRGFEELYPEALAKFLGVQQ